MPRTSVWEPVEGEFGTLMHLLIEDSDLEQWESSKTHFPVLQEVSLSMSEIATLERMELVDCCFSAVDAARKILDDRQRNGNDDLKLHIESEFVIYKMTSFAFLV